MGTSTKRPRPAGAQWNKAAHAHRVWQETGYAGDTVSQPAGTLRQALARQVEQDPDAFDLRPTMRASGARLVDELNRLTRDGLASYLPPEHSSAAARRLAFTRRFVDQIAGSGGTFADAAVRKAAVQAAEQLLSDEKVRRAVETGALGGLSIPRDLFCAIYRMFFAQTVEQFLTTVIAEGTSTVLTAHVPVLPLIDPQGQISGWFSQNVVAMLPTPCKDAAASGPALADLGRSLVTETVDRALGIPASGGTS